MPALDPIVTSAHNIVATAYLAAVMLLAHTHPTEARRLADEHDRFRRVTRPPDDPAGTSPTP